MWIVCQENSTQRQNSLWKLIITMLISFSYYPVFLQFLFSFFFFCSGFSVILRLKELNQPDQMTKDVKHPEIFSNYFSLFSIFLGKKKIPSNCQMALLSLPKWFSPISFFFPFFSSFLKLHLFYLNFIWNVYRCN